MLIDEFHGEQYAQDTRNGGTARGCGKAAPRRDPDAVAMAAADAAEADLFARISEFVRPRILPKVLAGLIGRVKVRQVQAKYAGKAPWTGRDIAVLLKHFREDFVQAVLAKVARAGRPRRFRMRWGRA